MSNTAEVDYDKIYENWKDYPLVKRAAIPQEKLWVRVLPSGDIGLDNNPLNEEFRWQDVLRGGKVIHRRWKTKVWYQYTDVVDDKASEARRGELYEALKDLGDPNFFWPGRAYVLMESDDAAGHREKVISALEKLDFETAVAPLWHIKGEPEPEVDDFINTVVIPPNAGLSAKASSNNSTDAFIARVKEQLSTSESSPKSQQDSFSSTIPQ